ncbi:MAG: GGDEF domain-containing protein [Bilophila wadsworthia]
MQPSHRDHALIETAQRRSMLNEGDIAGRIGGDEFTFSGRASMAALENASTNSGAGCRSPCRTASMSASIGIAAFPMMPTTPGFRLADASMYADKRRDEDEMKELGNMGRGRETF